MQLPHELDRLNQQLAFDAICKSDKKFIILKAPTGSGKTAVAAAMAALNEQKTLAIVQTKSLQGQYNIGYGFDGRVDTNSNL